MICGMLLRNRFIACVLIASIAAPSISIAGAQGPYPALESIAIDPIIDGDGDDEARIFALAVGDELRMNGSYRVIEQRVADDLRGYIDEPKDVMGDDVDALLTSARESYFQFNYSRSKKQLTRAIAELKQRYERDPMEGGRVVDALLLRALAANASGDKLAVAGDLAEVLKIDPVYLLQPQKYPPSMIELFESEKNKISDSNIGSLHVESSPAGAEIYLNGNKVGISPVDLQALPYGSYRISASANRYDGAYENVVIGDAGASKVKIKLKWKKGGATGEVVVSDDGEMISRGVAVADILKVDRVLLIDIDNGESMRALVRAQLVDRKGRAAHRVLTLKGSIGGRDGGLKMMKRLVKKIEKNNSIDIAKDPGRTLDPKSPVDPAMIANNKRKIGRSPILWGAVGLAVVGGIIGGILSSFSSSGGNPGTGMGSVRVEFK